MRNNCEIILNLDQWFKGNVVKYISYLELWQNLCGEQSHQRSDYNYMIWHIDEKYVSSAYMS